MKTIETMQLEAETLMRSYQKTQQKTTSAQQPKLDESCDGSFLPSQDSSCSSLSSMSSMTSRETDSLLSAPTNASNRGLHVLSPTAFLSDWRLVSDLEEPDFKGVFVSYGSVSNSTEKLKQYASPTKDLEAGCVKETSSRLAACKRGLTWLFVKEKPWSWAETIFSLMVLCLFFLTMAGAFWTMDGVRA